MAVDVMRDGSFVESAIVLGNMGLHNDGLPPGVV